MDEQDPDKTLDPPASAISSDATVTPAAGVSAAATLTKAPAGAAAPPPQAKARESGGVAPLALPGPLAPVSREEPGRYQMVREFGRGGQAVVMLARDKHIGRDVAFKRILGERLFGESPSTSAPAIRFLREARITGQLEHPGIVPVHEVGTRADGSLYYTQKLVRGRTLRAALDDCRSLADRLRLLPHFSDVCNAIAYANGRGVLHRDLKPENVMVGEFGETVVLDWGLAKVRGADDAPAHAEGPLTDSQEAALTQAGAAIGTPLYMSPEQARGEVDRVDERSEVWSLGVMLYELLAGDPPFLGERAREVIEKVAREEVPPIRDPEAPPDLVAVAMRALQRDRDARYPSARELAREVLAFQSGARVLAYEYSSWELVRRFARRNPLVSIVSALALVVLLVAMAAVHRARLSAVDSLADALQGRAVDAAQDARWGEAGVYYAASRAHRDGPEARWGEELARTLAPAFGSILPGKGLVRAAVSADGARLATASGSEVRIYDAASGALVSSEEGEGAVASIAFAGAQLAVARGHSVKLAGRAFATGSEAHAIAVSHGGALLAVAPAEGGVQLFRISSGERLFAAPGPRASSLAFDDGDERVFSSGWDGVLRAHALDGSEAVKVELSGGRLWGLAVSGNRLAVGNQAGVLRLWNEGLSAAPLVYADTAHGLAALAFSPGGRMLAAAGRDGHVRLRDGASGRLLAHFRGADMPAGGLAFTPGGAALIVSMQGAGAQIWRLRTPQPQATLTGFKGGAVVTFAPGGEWLATSGADGTQRRIEAATGRELERRRGEPGHGLAVSPEGTRLAIGDEKGGVWIASVGALAQARQLFNAGGRAAQVTFSPDGARLASVHDDGALRVFDLATGSARTLPAGQEKLGAVAWSPDGKRIATGGDDTTIKLWDAAALTPLATLRGHPGRLRALAFSPDGKLLASGSNNRVALVFRVEDSALVARLEGHEGPIRAVAFSPSGRSLATASQDRSVRIWEMPSGEPALRLLRHDDQLAAISWSSRGLFASASDDGTLELLELREPADLPEPSRSLDEIERSQRLKMVRFELRPLAP